MRSVISTLPPIRLVVAAFVLAVVAALGWFGATKIASAINGNSSTHPDFVPHASACVNKLGVILVKPHCSANKPWYEKTLLIASEEKVDAVGAYVKTASTPIDTNPDKSVDVSCDTGDRAIAGGASLSQSVVFDRVAIQGDYPTGGNTTTPATGWHADAVDLVGGVPAWSLTVHVVCTTNLEAP